MTDATEVKPVPELQKMSASELRAHLDGATREASKPTKAVKPKAAKKPAKAKAKTTKAVKPKSAKKPVKAKAKTTKVVKPKAAKKSAKAQSRASITPEQIRAALKGGGRAATDLAKLWKVTPPTVKRLVRKSKLTNGGKPGDLRGTVGRRPLIFTLK